MARVDADAFEPCALRVFEDVSSDTSSTPTTPDSLTTPTTRTTPTRHDIGYPKTVFDVPDTWSRGDCFASMHETPTPTPTSDLQTPTRFCTGARADLFSPWPCYRPKPIIPIPVSIPTPASAFAPYVAAGASPPGTPVVFGTREAFAAKFQGGYSLTIQALPLCPQVLEFTLRKAPNMGVHTQVLVHKHSPVALKADDIGVQVVVDGHPVLAIPCGPHTDVVQMQDLAAHIARSRIGF